MEIIVRYIYHGEETIWRRQMDWNALSVLKLKGLVEPHMTSV